MAQLLVHAVLLFTSAMDPHDHVIARLADDEFGVLLFNTGSGQAARNAAERLQATLADPFTVGSQSLFVTASMGIALCVSGYEGADELVRGAHIASFKAPSEGMSRIALFDPATAGQLRGESTPFYLYDRAAQQRIRALIPDAKLIAVLRDPIERAHSNWTHLWSAGRWSRSPRRAARCRPGS